jgi:4-carboxymuconolactone decarboxylase
MSSSINESQNSIAEPRLIPHKMDDMKPEWLDILKRIPGEGLKGKFAPVNVLGSLMYNPDTLGPFLDYWVTSKQKMGFSVREQELVILRMGYHYSCDYVWKHHIPVAIEFGVNQNEIDGLKSSNIPDIYPAREKAILELTDEMMNHRNVSDTSWRRYKTYLTDAEIIDLISLISQYVLFALTNNVIRVKIEDSLSEIESLK